MYIFGTSFIFPEQTCLSVSLVIWSIVGVIHWCDNISNSNPILNITPHTVTTLWPWGLHWICEEHTDTYDLLKYIKDFITHRVIHWRDDISNSNSNHKLNVIPQKSYSILAMRPLLDMWMTHWYIVLISNHDSNNYINAYIYIYIYRYIKIYNDILWMSSKYSCKVSDVKRIGWFDIPQCVIMTHYNTYIHVIWR